jgi:uncharacterized DUF497 family protein
MGYQKKEVTNLEKHGIISFVAAARVLLKKHYEARLDRHSEIRYLAIGEVKNRVLAVEFTQGEEISIELSR